MLLEEIDRAIKEIEEGSKTATNISRDYAVKIAEFINCNSEEKIQDANLWFKYYKGKSEALKDAVGILRRKLSSYHERKNRNEKIQ